LPEDFPELAVIRRGFGGSTTEDVLYFFERIILPYEPEAIVFFAGVNDIGAGRLPQEVVDNTERLVQRVATELPGTRVYVLTNTISVGRKALARSYQRVNVLLARMLRRYDHARLVDVTTPTLDRRGLPRGELFRADSIHLNPKGYAVWTEALRPVLVPDTAGLSSGQENAATSVSEEP
jgi:lysophospholipase L1-like esterase